MYHKIIFVGDSGACREPMAAEIFKDLGSRLGIEAEARGIVVLFPEPLNQKAEAIMASNGLSLDGFMSKQLEQEDFAEDTLILAMESKQREKVLEMFPECEKDRVYVLTEYVGDELEIVDPYGGSLQTYGICFETLAASIKKLIKILNEGE